MTFTGVGVQVNSITGDPGRSRFDLSTPMVDPKCQTLPSDCVGSNHLGGLLFEGNAALAIAQAGPVPVTGQLVFVYKATCNGPGCQINDNHLLGLFGTTVGAPSNTYGEEHEMVFADAALSVLLAEKDARFDCDSSSPPDDCGGPGGFAFTREDHAVFGGHKDLWILKELTLLTHMSGEAASVELIKQNFTTPEPGSMALLGLSLVGAGWARRRRPAG